MLFNSTQFPVFLPIVLLVAGGPKRAGARKRSQLDIVARRPGLVVFVDGSWPSLREGTKANGSAGEPG